MSSEEPKKTWASMRAELGDKEAKRLIVARLRELADHIEGDESPYLAHWSEESKCPFVSVELDLSHPWGG